jgi:hypothetical protein
MRANRRKVALCCEDPLLQDYLRRVLEQCPTLEVVCSPPPAADKGTYRRYKHVKARGNFPR